MEMIDTVSDITDTEINQSGQKGSCMLLSLKDKNMLVPRNIVAEVVRHTFLQFSEDEESGMKYFEWRGCQVPYIANSLVGEFTGQEIDDDTRVVIFYGLKNNTILPFYGFTVAKSPQLLQVDEEDLTEVTDTSLHPGELMQISFNDTQAFIPKVDFFENSVLKLIQ